MEAYADFIYVSFLLDNKSIFTRLYVTVCAAVCPEKCELCSYYGDDEDDSDGEGIVTIGSIRCVSCSAGYYRTSPIQCSGWIFFTLRFQFTCKLQLRQKHLDIMLTSSLFCLLSVSVLPFRGHDV